MKYLYHNIALTKPQQDNDLSTQMNGK